MRIVGASIALCFASLAVLGCAEGSDRRDDARIIAAFSTWTQLSFILTTTTMPATCAVVNPVACKKRKKRSFGNFLKNLKVSNTASDGALDGSLASPGGDVDSEGSQRDPKIALTVWRSHTSTFTMLMTSTDFGTTFSLSFACSIVGGNFPPACPPAIR